MKYFHVNTGVNVHMSRFGALLVMVDGILPEKKDNVGCDKPMPRIRGNK